MSEVEKLADIINGFFGCDAAYFDVNPFDLATYLLSKGVHLHQSCNECQYLSKRRVAMVCEHPCGLKVPTLDSCCSKYKPKL